MIGPPTFANATEPIGACQYRHVNDVLKNNRDQRAPATASEWISPDHEHWHAWIGDATIADAILDRIMQRNHVMTQ